MLARLRRPGVLPATMMFIIILWALAAVLMLINILITATHIENRVGVINSEVSPIDNELDSVTLAGEVAATSEKINAAAAPLTGQLTTTNEAVKSIDTDVDRILATAGEINTTATEINGTVQQINANVNTIGATLNSVEANALSIGDSVDGINGSFTGVLSNVQSIDGRVALANAQVDTLLGQVETIGSNVGAVDDAHVPAIVNHAAAIDESPLLLNLNQQALAALAQQQQAGPAQAGALPVPGELLPAPDELLPVPEVGDLPVPDAGELPLLGALQSPDGASPNSDTGSILESVIGAL